MNKVLSVIITVYNLEDCLFRCLDSIYKQTYKDLQIIIVDDGSSDHSREICEQYLANDKRAELYIQENKGVSAARNLGMSMANGDYITFVDGDDYLSENTYEIVMDQIDDEDALYFGFIERYEEENINKIISPSVTGTLSADEALYQCLLPLGYHAFSCNKIFKREIVCDSLFDQELKIGEDEYWLVKVSQKLGRVKLINDPLYIYVQRKGSAMHSTFQINERWITVLKSKKKIISLLSEKNKCYRLARAKVYNDLFHLTWYGYVSGNMKDYKLVYDFIDQYKKVFFDAKEYGIKRKIKFFVIETMIKMRFPKKAVEMIGDATSYKTKILLTEGKRL